MLNMSTSELIKNAMSKLKELEGIQASSDEFDTKSAEILQIFNVSNMTENTTESQMVLLSATRLHCINAINMLMMIGLQGKFNKLVRDKLKETGKDVIAIDSFLNEKVRPYFADFDQ